MSNVRYLKDYTQNLEKRPREIRFFSPTYRDQKGRNASISVCITIEDGDIGSVLDIVIQDGGVGRTGDDGVFRFVPWPCAAIEVRNL